MSAQYLLRTLDILLIRLPLFGVHLVIVTSLDFDLFIFIIATHLGCCSAMVWRPWLGCDRSSLPFEILSVRLSHDSAYTLDTTLDGSAGDGAPVAERAERRLSFEVGGSGLIATTKCLLRMLPSVTWAKTILDSKWILLTGVGLI